MYGCILSCGALDPAEPLSNVSQSDILPDIVHVSDEWSLTVNAVESDAFVDVVPLRAEFPSLVFRIDDGLLGGV